MTSKVWEVMNDLEMVTSKIVSAREIIDTAAEAIQRNEYDKAETLATAAYEFLGYYLDEFDAKFKLAWQETVKKQDKGFEVDTTLDDCMPPWGHSDLEYLSKHKEPLSCDKDDPSPECQGAWNSFWEDNYYQDYMISRNDPTRLKYESGWVYESPNGGKTITKRKVGSTEKIIVKEDKVVKWQLPVEMDPSGECFVLFPDDLLEATNLKEGDQVEWVDRGDGSYLLRKITSPLKMDEC
jgi:hypothetical protein